MYAGKQFLYFRLDLNGVAVEKAVNILRRLEKMPNKMGTMPNKKDVNKGKSGQEPSRTPGGGSKSGSKTGSKSGSGKSSSGNR
jgi:hypothetical protein